jgi:thiamine pyrophosphokinase
LAAESVIVLAGGPEPAVAAATLVSRAGFVVAADAGVDHALALGLRIDVAVGDFDSATAAGLEAAGRAGARVVRHPPAKDATDLELALDLALEQEPRRILVVGGDGGRLDHLLGELLLLGRAAYVGPEIDALLGGATVHVVRGERTLTGEPGETISLLALHGPAEGVTTEGLVYPLRGETLEPGSSRGISNVFAGATARIVVGAGIILAVRPG